MPNGRRRQSSQQAAHPPNDAGAATLSLRAARRVLLGLGDGTRPRPRALELFRKHGVLSRPVQKPPAAAAAAPAAAAALPPPPVRTPPLPLRGAASSKLKDARARTRLGRRLRALAYPPAHTIIITIISITRRRAPPPPTPTGRVGGGRSPTRSIDRHQFRKSRSRSTRRERQSTKGKQTMRRIGLCVGGVAGVRARGGRFKIMGVALALSLSLSI